MLFGFAEDESLVVARLRQRLPLDHPKVDMLSSVMSSIRLQRGKSNLCASSVNAQLYIL